jgi:hypothetical protein
MQGQRIFLAIFLVNFLSPLDGSHIRTSENVFGNHERSLIIHGILFKVDGWMDVLF